MISVDRALEIVLEHALRPARTTESLLRARGAVLARDVRADRDLPPFDRAAVDGFAVRLDGAWNESGTLFRLRGQVAAGDRFRGRLAPGEAVHVMTGAPVPPEADGVVMVERSEPCGSEQVRLTGPFEAKAGRPGLAPRGQDARRGEPLLLAGTRLTPAQIAILASIGVTEPPVWKRPSVTIVTTGDEVVEPDQKPRPEQIRNSNGALLQAMLSMSGWVGSVRARRARDRMASLRRTLDAGRDFPDVLVFTGGVSMGQFDLVPDLLQEAGFSIHFHRIALRPGKPLLFATRRKAGKWQVAFGLPGNPVSVCVTAWEFLLPLLRKSSGTIDPRPFEMRLPVARDLHRKPGLTHFIPARISETIGTPHDGLGDRLSVAPVSYHGSGDFIALGYADALIRIEAENSDVEAGTPVVVHPLFREREMSAAIPSESKRAREVAT